MSHVWSPSESIEIDTPPVDGSERIDNEIDSSVKIEIPNSVRIRGSSKRKEHDRLHQEAMIVHQQFHQEALAQHQKLLRTPKATRSRHVVQRLGAPDALDPQPSMAIQFGLSSLDGYGSFLDTEIGSIVSVSQGEIDVIEEQTSASVESPDKNSIEDLNEHHRLHQEAIAEHHRLHQEALMQQHGGLPLKKGPRLVSCGAHKANSCEECPQGHGEAWCNGDCEWNIETDTCVRGPRFVSDDYEDLLDLELRPFQAVRDENGKLVNVMLIKAPLETMQDRLAFEEYKDKIVFLGIMSYERFPLSSPNPYSNKFDDNLYVDNPGIQGWLNMYRNPHDIFQPTTPIIRMSQSDFGLPKIDLNKEMNDGKHEKQYDFVYSMSNGGHLFNNECTGWGPEAKNWTFAKEALEVMCGELNLTGVLLATTNSWDSKPCEIPKSCEGKIVQTPYIDFEDAMAYFRRSRFLFIPQVNDASPRVVTQAMTLNVPVLMNKNIIGGWKYINKKTGEFFNDLSDFKESYLRLKANMDDYEPREYILENYGDHNAGRRLFDFVNEKFSDKVQLPEGSNMLIPS